MGIICAIILSSLCYCTSEVQQAEIQMKDSKLYDEYTSMITKTVKGEIVMDMLDFVCVCVTE